MNDILREHLDITSVGILDNVIIYSADPLLHIHHVRQILQILRANQLYAKIEKCEFNNSYMVSSSGIGMDPPKVSSVLDWPVPKSVKDVVFLGFCKFLSEVYYGLLNTHFSSHGSNTQGCQKVYLDREGRCLVPPIATCFHIRSPPPTLPTRSPSHHRSRCL